MSRITNHFILIVLLIFISCKKKLAPIATNKNDKHFSLVSPKQTGVKFVNALSETAKSNHLINENFVTGACVAMGNINTDGLPDIYFAENQLNDKSYLNKGNLVFKDVSQKFSKSIFINILFIVLLLPPYPCPNNEV